MAVVEVARRMTSVIGKRVDPVMLFDKGEYMDNILSDMLCAFYDIKGRKFKKIEFIQLIIATTRRLGFPGNFTFNDFGERRERSKWMPFLSAFVAYFDCDFTEVVEVLESVRDRKRVYEELLESNKSREYELLRLQEAEWERRERVKTLESELCNLKLCYAEKNAMIESREILYQSLVCSSEEKKLQIESLKNKLQSVNKEYETTQCSLIEDCESLPELISNVESRLREVESSICKTYEAYKDAVGNLSMLQKYEDIINTELKPKFSEVHTLMDKLVAITNREKEYQGVVDSLIKDNKKVEAELKKVEGKLSECRKQLETRKALLNNKRKTCETDGDDRSRKINSLVCEEGVWRKKLSAVSQENSSTMKQINTEEKALQEEVSKSRILFEQLEEVLLDLSHIIERTA